MTPGSFTYHDESFFGSSVLVRSLSFAWLHADWDVRVRVNGERVRVRLLQGKLTCWYAGRCLDTTRKAGGSSQLRDRISAVSCK